MGDLLGSYTNRTKPCGRGPKRTIPRVVTYPPSSSSFFPPLPPLSPSLVILTGLPPPIATIRSNIPRKRLNPNLGRPRDHDKLRRRTRSMLPLRNLPFNWNGEDDEGWPGKAKFGGEKEEGNAGSTEKKEDAPSSEAEPSMSASSSRSSSVGRSSKRWVFLENFLGSKSEGRSNKKFWVTISFSLAKEKRPSPNNAGPKEKNSDPAEGIRGSTPKKGGGLVLKGGMVLKGGSRRS